MSAADRIVDARGMRCPWPLVRLARAMREADAVLFLTDDAQAIAELPALAAGRGWTARVSTCREGFAVSAT